MSSNNNNQNDAPKSGENKSYKEAATEFYNRQYDNWVPWAEEQYLKYFTKDNKASYATKQQLDQTKITGNDQVDNLQDGVHNLVAGQVGQGGLAEGVGDQVSGGISESEKNKNQNAGGMMGNVGEGVKGAGSSVSEGVSNVGSSVGGMLGGGGGKK